MARGVLVIDDSALIRHATQIGLSAAEDWQVGTAESGGEGAPAAEVARALEWST